MTISILRPLIIFAAIGLLPVSLPLTANAAASDQVQIQPSTIEAHFTPRPSVKTRLNFDTWISCSPKPFSIWAPAHAPAPLKADWKPELGLAGHIRLHIGWKGIKFSTP